MSKPAKYVIELYPGHYLPTVPYWRRAYPTAGVPLEKARVFGTRSGATQCLNLLHSVVRREAYTKVVGVNLVIAEAEEERG